MTFFHVFIALLFVEGWIVGTWSLVTGAVEDSHDGPMWAVIDGITWSVMSLIFAPFVAAWGWIRTILFFIKD